MSNLSTCGRCGGTIERRPGSVAGWGHVTETDRNADGHLPDPDDGYAATGADEEPPGPLLVEGSYADPWLDPDAAARAVPPPF
jgi:hypothetical protein